MARALLLRASVLVLDEATANVRPSTMVVLRYGTLAGSVLAYAPDTPVLVA